MLGKEPTRLKHELHVCPACFQNAHLIPVFSDKIINKWKSFLPHWLLLSVFREEKWRFVFLPLWRYPGGLHCRIRKYHSFLLQLLGAGARQLLGNAGLYYPFVKANKAYSALTNLRGKLPGWCLLAVCLPFMTLTILCDSGFSILMSCQWKSMWNIYSARLKQFPCRWWIAR